MSISIDYLPQMLETGKPAARALLEALQSIASCFNSFLSQHGSRITMGLRDTGLFDRLQASEAIRQVVVVLIDQEPRMRGIRLVVDHSDEAHEEVHRRMQQTALGLPSALGIHISTAARHVLGDYHPFGHVDDRSALSNPYHSTILADANAEFLSCRTDLAECILAAYTTMDMADRRIAFIETSQAYRSTKIMLDTLTPLTQDTPLICLLASKPCNSAYFPWAEALDQTMDKADLDSGQTELHASLHSLHPAYRALANSRISGLLPHGIIQGAGRYINTVLDGLSQRRALVLCAYPERFSSEALDIISQRITTQRGTERYLFISTAPPPAEWRGDWMEYCHSPTLAWHDRHEVITSALGAIQEPLRTTLHNQFDCIAHGQTSGRMAVNLPDILALLPREAACYLYALLLCENLLDATLSKELFALLGLCPAGIDILQSILKRCGLIDADAPWKSIQQLDETQLLACMDQQAATLIYSRYIDRLIARYHDGLINPSLAFLSRIGEVKAGPGISHDCLFADAMRKDGYSTEDLAFLSDPSRVILDFWNALARGLPDTATRIRNSFPEMSTNGQNAIIQALMNAELAYAKGDLSTASQQSRAALLSCTADTPPKLESKAHRMMGLATLAAERYSDATDYLSNAQELAETSGDHYERMMAAYARAITEFMTGTLVKAEHALDQAEESARHCIQIETIAAVQVLRGRIDMEYGEYDKASRRFENLANFGTAYAMPDVHVRARIWQGRANAYAHRFEEAGTIMEQYQTDPEARLFLGELEILRGQPNSARRWLQITDQAPAATFHPADRHAWGSPFEEIEGRCLNFQDSASPLKDVGRALHLFATGLDERNASCAVELYDLIRSISSAKANPSLGTFCLFCYLLEEKLPDPPVDMMTILSRAFKALQQRAGRIESRIHREMYMEQNAWNRRLLEAARIHSFI
jgi:tetratricopeptide (TPR) repeat protein